MYMTLFTCFCEVTLSFSTTLVLDPEDKNLIFELSTAEAEQMKICHCCLTSYNFGQSFDHVTEFQIYMHHCRCCSVFFVKLPPY